MSYRCELYGEQQARRNQLPRGLMQFNVVFHIVMAK